MVKKSCEVIVDAVVQRTVFVDASNAAEAEELACKEVKNLLGAFETEAWQVRKIEE